MGAKGATSPHDRITPSGSCSSGKRSRNVASKPGTKKTFSPRSALPTPSKTTPKKSARRESALGAGFARGLGANVKRADHSVTAVHRHDGSSKRPPQDGGHEDDGGVDGESLDEAHISDEANQSSGRQVEELRRENVPTKVASDAAQRVASTSGRKRQRGGDQGSVSSTEVRPTPEERASVSEGEEIGHTLQSFKEAFPGMSSDEDDDWALPPQNLDPQGPGHMDVEEQDDEDDEDLSGSVDVSLPFSKLSSFPSLHHIFVTCSQSWLIAQHSPRGITRLIILGTPLI